jgi:hypothetical protein
VSTNPTVVTLATDLTSAIQEAVQFAVAALPPAIGPSGPVGSAASPTALNIRDYGAQQNGTADDTAAIARAMADAGKPGYPSTVFVPGDGVTLSGPLSIPFPGVQLAGEGMMGMGSQNAKVSILRARNEASDTGPFFTADPALTIYGPSLQWLRGSSGLGGHLSFDVSMCQRFCNNPALSPSEPPPPVLDFRSLSNVPEIGDICVLGHEGTAYRFGTTATVATAVCEGLYIKNCYAYGGYGPTGAATGRPPIAPALVISGANQVRVVSGKFMYNNRPNPTGTMADIPGILIISEAIQLPDGTSSANIGANISIDSPSVTQYAVHVQIQGVDSGLYHYCPQFVTICNMTLESNNIGFKINAEPTSLQTSTWRSLGIRIYGNCCETPWPWPDAPPNVAQVIIDKACGGYLDVEFLRTQQGTDMTSGDIRMGPNTYKLQGRVGPNPNGQTLWRATDLGVGNNLSYAV